MQKWEYMILSYIQTQPSYINGQELKNWKTMPEMWTHLNQLGEEGWNWFISSGTATTLSLLSKGQKYKKPSEN